MSWLCDPGMAKNVTGVYQTAGPLMYNALNAFLAAQCVLTPSLFEDTTISSLLEISGTSYDFIVVGAGTAGSVVANRLTEIPEWNVLLLEAGGDLTLGTEIPQLFINNYGTAVDWNFRTEPQKNACLNYKDQKCYWPRGKVLGGSSSINGMYYIRGNKADYDDWAVIDSDWSYENVLPYFKKSENVLETGEIDRKYHGQGGYLNIEYNDNVHPIEKLIIDANQEIGINFNKDFNSKIQIGVGRAYTTTKSGKRQSSATAFLKPIKDRKNLKVLKNVHVNKIIFENNTAKGVQVLFENGESFEVFVNKEVILSAGSINSPIILLSSGIGQKEDIAPKARQDFFHNDTQLPVGENLIDHIYAPIMYKMKSDDQSNSLSNIFKNYYEYITEKKGTLGDLSPGKVITFINVTDPETNTPNIQNHFIVAYPNQSNSVDIFGQHRFSDQFYNSFIQANKDHLIIIVYVTILQPKSKGYINISKDNKPLIHANYLNNEEDLEILVQGMKHALKLADTETFINAKLKLHWIEIDACKNINKATDAFLKCIAKHLTGTTYHAVGTNKMGKKDSNDTVVGPDLKVKNVKNLRVVDASVMPNIVRGNTMAAVIMIAEKAADYIKHEWESKNVD